MLDFPVLRVHSRYLPPSIGTNRSPSAFRLADGAGRAAVAPTKAPIPDFSSLLRFISSSRFCQYTARPDFDIVAGHEPHTDRKAFGRRAVSRAGLVRLHPKSGARQAEVE